MLNYMSTIIWKQNLNKRQVYMSGHSKWANIKHKKGAADAKKGKIFSKFP